MISHTLNRALPFALLAIVSPLFGQEPETSTSSEPVEPGPAESVAEKMSNASLGKLISELAEEIQGQPGRWQFKLFEIQMICITDENADRMRIMSPIIPTEKLTPEQMIECMHANFDRALDARYCINDGIVWSTFIHPLGDLTPDLFQSAVLQVAGAKINFGTTYASGGLQFGGGNDENGENAEKSLKPNTRKPDFQKTLNEASSFRRSANAGVDVPVTPCVSLCSQYRLLAVGEVDLESMGFGFTREQNDTHGVNMGARYAF